MAKRKVKLIFPIKDSIRDELGRKSLVTIRKVYSHRVEQVVWINGSVREIINTWQDIIKSNVTFMIKLHHAKRDGYTLDNQMELVYDVLYSDVNIQ